jgi:hypothetical protein
MKPNNLLPERAFVFLVAANGRPMLDVAPIKGNPV